MERPILKKNKVIIKIIHWQRLERQPSVAGALSESRKRPMNFSRN